MNIFYFKSDPEQCGKEHCDKHCVKQILEYAQLLCTAHRVLDGKESIGISKSGRKQKVWTLDPQRDSILYKASHVNHPSNEWTRDCSGNYLWLYQLWHHLCQEYTHRYDKIHTTSKLDEYLKYTPKKIKLGYFSPPWRAMPDQYKVPKEVPGYCEKSYQAYFNGEKQHIASWKKRNTPEWFALRKD